MTAMFHDMMHQEIENYVDDIVVKSKKRENHPETLRKVFDRCRLYKLKMNPLKCAFRVSAGKFLGFLVHNHGIDVDSTKAFAIATMKAPTSHKELKSFLGRLSYIRRFIPGLAAVTAVFTPIMKKSVPFVWSTACQQAFEKIQAIINKLPTVCALVASRPLRLYLASNGKAIGALVAQEDESGIEKLRLRHYFLAHKIQLMTKSHPIRSLLHRPVLSSKLAQWLLQLSQYEIITETPATIKSQAIVDLLAQFPGEDSSSISHEVLGGVGEALLADLVDSIWTLKFDGSSTSSLSGAGIVLIKEDRETIAKSFKLDFSCSNNVSEYEAYITRLVITHEMGIKHLRKLEEKFDTFEISHAKRCGNRYADALATLGPQISFEGPKVDVTINKRKVSIIDLLKEEFEERHLDIEDWRTPIKTKLMSPEGVVDQKTLKDYVLIASDLYRRLPGGVLARCVSLREVARKLTEVHEKSCEFSDGVSLYRRLQHLGYFWPNMSKEAVGLQEQCSFCQHQHESDQVYTTFVSSDWRTPFLEYLIENILPQTSKAATQLKKLATRYFVEGGILFQKGFHGDPLRCLNLAESQIVMKEAHSGKCGEHQGKKRLYQLLLTLGYYWLTMKKDMGWNSHLAETLWAYRSSTKTETGFTPFSLVYGTDAIAPTKLLVPNPRILHGMDLEADVDICAETRIADLESLEEARELAHV
uniref:Reverse transcriptase domain-containing protein n=1 Tax=Fagus sylvatica TaxID=28930 RepID=A0A2N9IKF0_FAGSY